MTVVFNHLRVLLINAICINTIDAIRSTIALYKKIAIQEGYTLMSIFVGNHNETLISCLNMIDLDYFCCGNFDAIPNKINCIEQSNFTWISTNNSLLNIQPNFVDRIILGIKADDDLYINDKRVAIIGLSHVTSLSEFSSASSINESLNDFTSKYIKDYDLIIPLIYQSIKQDRESALLIASYSNKIPIILGGQEQFSCYESITNVRILKIDNTSVGIIDFKWEDSKLTTSVSIRRL
jgi:hypothetical protein